MAVDVCDLCYGDLCRSCALPLKGRKDRVCKDCALTVSGVRGNGKPEVRGDRRTVKSRRKAYAAKEQPEDFFQFFDAGLPADALVVGPPPPPVSKGDREKAAGTGSAGSADGSSTAADSAGIRRLLERLKPNESERNADDLVPIDEILTDGESGADQGEAGGKDADAVSQLTDIRRRDHAAATDTGQPAGAPNDASEVDGGPLIDASALPGAAELPSDSSVAIPSTLMQGFPDGGTDEDDGPADESEGPVQWSTAESMSAIAATDDVFADPRTDSSAPLGDSAGSTPDAGPPSLPDAEDHLLQPARQDDPVPNEAEPDYPDQWMQLSDLDDVSFTKDPFGTSTDAHEPTMQEERRRTLRPIGEYPAPPDQTGLDGDGASHPVGPLDQIPDVSPRLRDLVADLSNQPSPNASAENPFLKRSRVVSEPHAVPDFSTDPFSATDGGGSDSTPTDDQPRDRVPAPISPSASALPETAGPVTAPEPDMQPPTAQGQTAPQLPQPAQPSQPAEHPIESITEGTAVELPVEIPAAPEPDPVPDVEAQIPTAAAPEPAPAPPVDPPPPIAATQDPEPSTDAPPPSRRPIASYTPAERHPLAAFVDADRHPLAAFARRDTPSPSPEPPPIDDVFPDEGAPVEDDHSVGRQRDFTDVPAIDDLLLPESAETDLPSESAETDLPPESAETDLPPESAETDLPSESAETDLPPESATTDIPPESAETDVTPPQGQPLLATELLETLVPPNEPVEHPVPAEAIEPDEPPDSWVTWQPPEPSDSPAPAESWDIDEPTVSAAVAEEESVAPESVPDVASPESTVPATVADDSATWTGVVDVPDVGDLRVHGTDDRVDSAARQQADTDARGSWIPPALRGIAPDAHDAADNLPRRRR